MLIYNFNSRSNLRNWHVIDDVVMGGRSAGNMDINTKGHGVFSGEVSLENNGGFSSVRYQFLEKNVGDYAKVLLRVKGDGKLYQFRVKSDKNQRYSYIATFPTSGDWETIEIELKAMYPAFRGMRLNMSNYPAEKLAEIAILFGNKKNESFRLEIDEISLK